MAKPICPKKVHRYSDEFKTTALKLKAWIRFYNHHPAACIPALTATPRKSVRDWDREAVSPFSGEDPRWLAFARRGC